MEKIYITKTAGETFRLGQQIAKNLKGKTVLALYGELGSGKTTFVQGLAQGLGITKRIISPTFIIVRSYAIKPTTYNLKPITFYHIDLYRIENQRDLEGLGIEEILNDPQNIVAIEWAEKMGRLLPKKRWDAWFEYISEGKRRITIKSI